ncbi:hypothetical protein Tco_0428900 [Tanacetum coccineum]
MGSLKTSGSKKGVMMSKHAVTTPGFSESLLKFLIVMGFGGVEAVVATNEQPNVEATQKDDVPVVIVTRALKVNYRAAKGGVIAFTEGAAKEYSESGINIRIIDMSLSVKAGRGAVVDARKRFHKADPVYSHIRDKYLLLRKSTWTERAFAAKQAPTETRGLLLNTIRWAGCVTDPTWLSATWAGCDEIDEEVDKVLTAIFGDTAAQLPADEGLDDDEDLEEIRARLSKVIMATMEQMPLMKSVVHETTSQINGITTGRRKRRRTIGRKLKNDVANNPFRGPLSCY